MGNNADRGRFSPEMFKMWTGNHAAAAKIYKKCERTTINEMIATYSL
jgi:hypothetical protein